ncbi:unnamed protein product [Onchocerca flexuosa]|uniref:Uncharacterized protein n=1 Tax=Onchocerca flexuosa TaxID=387005 RepID=A0A183HAS8_9BILA|nr:unnamed protein product [Onchocerca flexuosa]
MLDENKRKRNILLEDKKNDDFLAPKRSKKVNNQSDRILGENIVKVVRQEPVQENEHMHELESTLSIESSSAFLLPVRPRLPSNPFKRKSQTIFDSNEDNFFDSLASASTTSRKKNDDISDWKKLKTELSKTRQTTLSMKLAEEKESNEMKTGFELWLKSAESKLRKDYDGDDDFLEYAIKQFRHLKTEEKQVEIG